MKNLQKFLLTALMIFGFLAFTACNDDENTNVATDGSSRIRVSMTDAPGDYDAVFVEVVDVRIKNDSGTDENGWVSIGNVSPRIINLLDLTGGVTVMLADNQSPSGHLGQIRLILGSNNTVVKNGVSYELRTPSAQQSGLKLKIDQNLQPGITYDFLIDFDVEHSIVEAGNSGNINLHPVLRVTSNAVSGSIKGKVVNEGITSLVAVTVGNTTVTTYTNADGVFVLHGLPQGSYTVTVTPEILSGLPIRIVQNVSVTNGQVTDMGLLNL